MELLAEEAKKDGNKCMKEGKHVEAMFHYTKAIKIMPEDPTFYSNRALAFQHLQQYYYALQDANMVVRLTPKWSKGYYRQGEIYAAAEQYMEAIMSFEKALLISPDDVSIRKALDDALEKWKAQKRVEMRLPWYGILLGTIAGIALIVFDDAITKNPIFKDDTVRCLVLAVIVGACYGLALLYRYMLRSQRSGLLDEPIDLFPDRDSGHPITTQPTSSQTAESVGQADSTNVNGTTHRQTPSHTANRRKFLVSGD